jgi:hypothetical protein
MGGAAGDVGNDRSAGGEAQARDLPVHGLLERAVELVEVESGRRRGEVGPRCEPRQLEGMHQMHGGAGLARELHPEGDHGVARLAQGGADEDGVDGLVHGGLRVSGHDRWRPPTARHPVARKPERHGVGPDSPQAAAAAAARARSGSHPGGWGTAPS